MIDFYLFVYRNFQQKKSDETIVPSSIFRNDRTYHIRGRYPDILGANDNGRIKYTYAKYVCGDIDLDMWHRPFRSPSTDTNDWQGDVGATDHCSYNKWYWKCPFYPYRFSFYSNCLNQYCHRTNENLRIYKRKKFIQGDLLSIFVTYPV